jgi:hypothetical protein
MGGGIYYNYKTKIAGVAQGQSIPLVRERSWVRSPTSGLDFFRAYSLMVKRCCRTAEMRVQFPLGPLCKSKRQKSKGKKFWIRLMKLLKYEKKNIMKIIINKKP